MKNAAGSDISIQEPFQNLPEESGLQEPIPIQQRWESGAGDWLIPIRYNQFTLGHSPLQLEDQFQTKLNGSWTTRKHTRVVKRGAGHVGKRQVGRVGDSDLTGIDHAAVADGELFVIKRVKEFSPELQFHPFADFKIFED